MGDRTAESQARRWLAQSEHDLNDARMAAESGRHALAFFMCHQSAEKAVAGYLYSKGAESVWGHSLSDLCQDAMALDPSFDFIRSIAMLLDKLFLGARYPSGLPGGVPAETYESLDSERALEVAGDVRDFSQRTLAIQPTGKGGLNCLCCADWSPFHCWRLWPSS